MVARNWDAGKANEMIRATLKWRGEFKPDQLDIKEMHDEAAWGLMYRRGVDKLRRPVLLVRPAGKSSEAWDVQLRHITFNFEAAIASMEEGVEQLVWLVDYRSFALMSAPPLSFGKSVM